jgi:hypothetical protein
VIDPVDADDAAASDSAEASDADSDVELEASFSAASAEEPATEPVEVIDDKTRPIELPAKSDNELF